jgi:hypothetical protein
MWAATAMVTRSAVYAFAHWYFFVLGLGSGLRSTKNREFFTERGIRCISGSDTQVTNGVRLANKSMNDKDLMGLECVSQANFGRVLGRSFCD